MFTGKIPSSTMAVSNFFDGINPVIYFIDGGVRMEQQQEKRQTLQGKCNFCGGIFGKRAMTKHLEKCRQGKIFQTPSNKNKLRKVRVFHITVEGRYNPEYWMHIEISADAKLKDLDSFLRDIWLECCGHLSSFEIAGRTYVEESGARCGGKDRNIMLSKVLIPGMKFYHQYDFGTTTELILKVVSERESELSGNTIVLCARNEPPLILCESCGKTATQVCSQCIGSGAGWLCDACAEEHECGEEMFLPVVNSPRVGCCGYTGPVYDE